ncbi:MAG: CHAD domain-containing protein [Gemmataceae bacterium]|nr:CHAD domain-containing protein [Gemmataceae bacterium]
MADGKWITGLSPGMPAAAAARAVLAARFRLVRYYLPLAVERPYADAEHVHQLRVGTRRAAAAVRVFRNWLPGKHRRPVEEYLRTVRRAAGDARDWDVFLAGLAARHDSPAFDFLLGFATGERAAAQDRLVEAAREADTEVAVHLNKVRAPDGTAEAHTLADLASEHLPRLVGEFTAAAEANPDTPAALHRLRILGKRLRYAIELFVCCYAAPLKDELYPAVEAAQELLGGLQDAAVGTTRLRRLRDQVRQAVPAEWPRLEPGVEAMLAELKEKVPAARAEFGAWREGWLRLAAGHPLDALRASTTRPSEPGA